MPSAKAKILVAPIAFNEMPKIKRVIEKLLQEPTGDKILMDDASNDETVSIAKEMDMACISHNQRRGVGAAIRTVIRHAQKNGYDILVIMAGNDKDDPSEIPRLVKPIMDEACDFVQGSRYLKKGRYGQMPFYRMIATRFLHPLLFSLVAGKKITDSTNGFRAIRLSVLEDQRINLDQNWLDRYELEPYLFFKFITLGYKVKEVPVTKIYPEKKLGYTKMKPITGWWSILRPLVLLGLRIKK